MNDFIGTELKVGDFFLHSASGGITTLRFGMVTHVKDHVILAHVYVRGGESFVADNYAIYENDSASHISTGLAKVPETFVPLPVVQELRNPTNLMKRMPPTWWNRR